MTQNQPQGWGLARSNHVSLSALVLGMKRDLYRKLTILDAWWWSKEWIWRGYRSCRWCPLRVSGFVMSLQPPVSSLLFSTTNLPDWTRRFQKIFPSFMVLDLEVKGRIKRKERMLGAFIEWSNNLCKNTLYHEPRKFKLPKRQSCISAAAGVLKLPFVLSVVHIHLLAGSRCPAQILSNHKILMIGENLRRIPAAS